MKITKIQAVPVRVPRNKVLYASQGTISSSEFGIVLIDTDEGIRGLGEISMNLDRAGISLSHDVNTLLAPVLEGKDPLRIQELVRLMDLTIRGSEAAKSGVEMALFDIVGKYFNVPVYQLLGGKVRDRVEVTWGFGFGDPQIIAEDTAAYVEQGFRHFKLKTGRPGTGEDEATVRALRERYGDAIHIRVDANTAYSSPLEAVNEIRRLEQYDLQLVEQPLKGRQIDGMALVRRMISTPLMADESMYHWSDAIELIKKEAADVFSVYISESGGLLAAQKAFAIAEAAGMPALIGSQCEMGIGTAAQMHLAVAMPNLAYSSDLGGPLRYPYHLVNEQFQYEDGTLRPFEGPGLGVTLDEDAFEHSRIDR